MVDIGRLIVAFLVTILLVLLASSGCSSNSEGVLNSPSIDNTLTPAAGQAKQPPLPRWVSAAQSDKPVACPGAYPTAGQAPKTFMLFDDGSYDTDGYIVSWQWNFADQYESQGGWNDYTSTEGTAYHTYTVPGKYNAHLRVTDNQGKKGTAKITITVTVDGNINPVATANADPLFGTAPLTVSFTADGSSDPDGFLVKWEWDLLGDGVFADYTATEGVASFTYVASGTYNPILRVTDDNGAVAVADPYIYVNQVPNAVAAATPNYGYPPMTVSFDGSSSNDFDGSIEKYEWDFGEGGGFQDYGSTPTASHTYNSAGNYTALLRVTDDAGATATDAVSVDTTAPPPNQPPVADGSVTPLSGTNPLPVQFDGSDSYDPDGVIIYWEWDLGDGSGYQDYTASQGALEFTYINAGDYTAILRVTDDNDETDTANYPIHVNARPNALGSVTPDAGNSPLECAFSASGSTDADGSIVKWEWDFGEGGGFAEYTATQGATTHTYENSGDYTAILRVTDNEGGQDVNNVAISVTEANPSGGWTMFGREPTHNRRSPYVGAQTNNLKWTFTTGDCINSSSPAIGYDGTVYVGSGDGNLYAINPDGSLKWAYATGGDVDCSPAIGSDGTIYVGSFDNNLYAINPDGSLKWSYETGGGIRWAPNIADDGTIYVDNFDCQVYAINPDGTFKWSYATLGEDLTYYPTIGPDSTVYVGSDDGNLYALYPDGTLKWVFSDDCWGIAVAPAIASDGTIYFGCYNGNFYALNADGSLKWLYHTGGSDSSAAIGADGTVYVGGANNVYALKSNGMPKWAFPTGGAVYSSPAIGADGTVYVGSDDYKFYAINPDGSGKWAYTTGGAIGSSSPAIDVDGTVYVGSWDGKLYAFGGDAPNQPPVAALEADPSSGYSPLLVAFDASDSIDNDGSIVSFDWDWDGNGTGPWDFNSGTYPTVTQEYETGYHKAWVRATDDDGATSIAYVNIFVEATQSPPEAIVAADPNSGEAPLEVEFDASDSYVDGGETWLFEWDWDGDGTGPWNFYSGEEPMVTHVYEEAGVYHAWVRITDLHGDTGIAEVVITVTSGD